MPTYEYRCQACNHEWEAVQSMKDDALTDCPSCGEPKAKRQISAGTGFILKGGGWYADGYGSGGTGQRSEATKTTEADASSYKSKKKTDSASTGDSSSSSSSGTGSGSGGSTSSD